MQPKRKHGRLCNTSPVKKLSKTALVVCKLCCPVLDPLDDVVFMLYCLLWGVKGGSTALAAGTDSFSSADEGRTLLSVEQTTFPGRGMLWIFWSLKQWPLQPPWKASLQKSLDNFHKWSHSVSRHLWNFLTCSWTRWFHSKESSRGSSTKRPSRSANHSF